MPIVRQKMQEFVNSGGVTMEASKPVYVRNAPIVVQAQQSSDGADPYAGLTPKERVAKRKEEEILRKQ